MATLSNNNNNLSLLLARHSNTSYDTVHTAVMTNLQALLILSHAATTPPSRASPLPPTVMDKSNAHVRDRPVIYVDENQLFRTFIKILFKYLSKQAKDVHWRAQRVVNKYLHHMQQEQTSSHVELLWEALRTDLRQVVGSVHWSRANDYVRLLCAKNNLVLLK